VPFSYWVSEHLFWQLLSAAVVTLLATAALFALIRWAFGLLKQSRQQITFLIASPIFLFVIFGGVLTTIAYLQPRPNFKTYIRMASTVGKTDLDIKSPVVLVVSIANIGNMQSTADGWQLTTELDRNKFDGVPVTLSPDTRVAVTSNAGIPFHFAPGGWLYSKGLESIEPGEMVTGFLIFQFPQLQPDAFARGTSKLTLKFADIMERTYVVRIEADQLNGRVPYFPGVVEFGS
jgi:hypothetical protein